MYTYPPGGVKGTLSVGWRSVNHLSTCLATKPSNVSFITNTEIHHHHRKTRRHFRTCTEAIHGLHRVRQTQNFFSRVRGLKGVSAVNKLQALMPIGIEVSYKRVSNFNIYCTSTSFKVLNNHSFTLQNKTRDGGNIQIVSYSCTKVVLGVEAGVEHRFRPMSWSTYV